MNHSGRNPFIETIERLTGKKVIEEKMSVIHDRTTPMDELVELALRTKDALNEERKIRKSGRKLGYVHTGMLDADRKLIKRGDKNTIREKKKLLKKLKKEIRQLERMRNE